MRSNCPASKTTPLPSEAPPTMFFMEGSLVNDTLQISKSGNCIWGRGGWVEKKTFGLSMLNSKMDEMGASPAALDNVRFCLDAADCFKPRDSQLPIHLD